MKNIKNHITLLIFILIGSFTSQLAAQEYNTAVGLRIGKGLVGSLKKTIRDDISIEFIAGVNSIKKVDYFGVGAIFQIHNNFAVDRLYWYYGGGATVAIQKDTYVALTLSTGIDYALDNLPINISFDYSPNLRFNDGIDLDHENIGVTLRYILFD